MQFPKSFSLFLVNKHARNVFNCYLVLGTDSSYHFVYGGYFVKMVTKPILQKQQWRLSQLYPWILPRAGNSTVLVLLQADTCIDTEQDPGIDHRNRQDSILIWLSQICEHPSQISGTEFQFSFLLFYLMLRKSTLIHLSGEKYQNYQWEDKHKYLKYLLKQNIFQTHNPVICFHSYSDHHI